MGEDECSLGGENDLADTVTKYLIGKVNKFKPNKFGNVNCLLHSPTTSAASK